MFCTVKHGPILKCKQNTASMFMKTHATSSTFELRVTVKTTLIVSQREWRWLKGAVINIKFSPFYGVFF